MYGVVWLPSWDSTLILKLAVMASPQPHTWIESEFFCTMMTNLHVTYALPADMPCHAIYYVNEWSFQRIWLRVLQGLQTTWHRLHETCSQEHSTPATLLNIFVIYQRIYLYFSKTLPSYDVQETGRNVVRIHKARVLRGPYLCVVPRTVHSSPSSKV